MGVQEEGVKHYIWSTTASAKEASGGKYDKVEHWETKALVTKYIKETRKSPLTQPLLRHLTKALQYPPSQQPSST